jgi:hypothetical protein
MDLPAIDKSLIVQYLLLPSFTSSTSPYPCFNLIDVFDGITVQIEC